MRGGNSRRRSGLTVAVTIVVSVALAAEMARWMLARREARRQQPAAVAAVPAARLIFLNPAAGASADFEARLREAETQICALTRGLVYAFDYAGLPVPSSVGRRRLRAVSDAD